MTLTYLSSDRVICLVIIRFSLMFIKKCWAPIATYAWPSGVHLRYFLCWAPMAIYAWPLGGHLEYFFFILVAHGNLCLAIRWSLKIHWYVGCPWQPMPGLHFARFCFKLPQQILLISWPIGQPPVKQPAGDKTTKGNNWVQCKLAGH